MTAPAPAWAAVSDFPTRSEAELAAARLIGEGIAAAVVDDEVSFLPEGRPALGPRVVVQAGEAAAAVRLLRLLHEVDVGVSRLAPPLARSVWEAPWPQPLYGVAVAAVLAAATLLVLAAALVG
ncbi:MAG: hypothetical protein ACKVWR_19470 [Acidimicrobiales bacterium]